eukprot:scaffold140080_cov45-Prasinocladus_malaysianus.AAC.1
MAPNNNSHSIASGKIIFDECSLEESQSASAARALSRQQSLFTPKAQLSNSLTIPVDSEGYLVQD